MEHSLPLPIATSRLTLRDYVTTDWRAVHAYACLPEVVRYEVWGPNTEADTRRFIAESIEARAMLPRRTYQLAIVLRDTAEVIGGCALFLSPTGETAELGITLHPQHWRCGLATEAGRALLETAFAATGVRETIARYAVSNEASQRLLLKLSFARVEQLLTPGEAQIGSWEHALFRVTKRTRFARQKPALRFRNT